MAKSNPFANLASLSMRQLRELARTLGVRRYSSEDRDGLADAIASRLPEDKVVATESFTEAAVVGSYEAPVVSSNQAAVVGSYECQPGKVAGRDRRPGRLTVFKLLW